MQDGGVEQWRVFSPVTEEFADFKTLIPYFYHWRLFLFTLFATLSRFAAIEYPKRKYFVSRWLKFLVSPSACCLWAQGEVVRGGHMGWMDGWETPQLFLVPTYPDDFVKRKTDLLKNKLMFLGIKWEMFLLKAGSLKLLRALIWNNHVTLSFLNSNTEAELWLTEIPKPGPGTRTRPDVLSPSVN